MICVSLIAFLSPHRGLHSNPALDRSSLCNFQAETLDMVTWTWQVPTWTRGLLRVLPRRKRQHLGLVIRTISPNALLVNSTGPLRWVRDILITKHAELAREIVIIKTFRRLFESGPCNLCFIITPHGLKAQEPIDLAEVLQVIFTSKNDGGRFQTEAFDQVSKEGVQPLAPRWSENKGCNQDQVISRRHVS